MQALSIRQVRRGVARARQCLTVEALSAKTIEVTLASRGHRMHRVCTVADRLPWVTSAVDAILFYVLHSILCVVR